MKKIVGLAIALLLLFALSAAPVLANNESQVVTQGSGQVILPGGFVANMMVYINTETGIVRNQATFPGGLPMDGQHVVALVGIGEVEDHEIIVVDGIVTVIVNLGPGQSYLLPSRDPVPMPGDNYFECTLTGPGKRGEISLVSPSEGNLFTIPGNIIIRWTFMR